MPDLASTVLLAVTLLAMLAIGYALGVHARCSNMRSAGQRIVDAWDSFNENHDEGTLVRQMDDATDQMRLALGAGKNGG